MTETKEVVGKGLTLKVVIAGVLLCALFSIYFQIVLNSVGSYSSSGYSDLAMKVMTFRSVVDVNGEDRMIVRNSQSWPLAMGLFIIVNIVAAYIVKIQGRKGVSPEILILMAMFTASLIVNINNGNGLQFTSWSLSTNNLGAAMYVRQASAEEWALVPSLLAVTDVAAWEAVLPVSTWTLPGAFYPVMAWNVLLYGSMTLFFILLSMVLKVLWFDVEAIPPLWAEVQNQSLVLVNATVQGEAGAGDRKKWFLIGILAQAVITLLFSSNGVIDDITNGPSDTLDWNLQGLLIGTDIQAPFIRDLGFAGILPWVGLFVSMQPFQVAFSYMIPLDILFSALLGWAIFKFLIPVSFTSMGLLPEFTAQRSRNIHQRLMQDQFVGANWAVGLNSGISMGLIIGLAIYPFIRYRARIIPMLRSITGKADKRLEELSPLPLKIVWFGLICCAIIYLGCWAAVGSNMSIITVTMFLNMLLTVGATRAGLYTAGTSFTNEFTSGGDNYRPPYYMPGMLAVNYIDPQPTATSGNAATWWAAVKVQGFMGQMNTQSQVLAHSLYSYKISEGFNINLKNTGIALILGFGAAIVAGAIGWQLKYAVIPWVPGGPMGTPNTITDSTASLLTNFGNNLWYDSTRQPIPVLLQLGDAGLMQYVVYCVVGFAIVPLMLLARKAVPQFRLLPEGLVFGAFLAGESYVIPAFFVGMVLRVITYKTGLVKAYSEKIQPLCMGLIVGYFIPISILIMIEYFYNVPLWQLWRLSQV